MIITVTLNTSIDRTAVISNFQTGRINRCEQPVEMAGGKGLNVTRALKNLGREVTATGFSGGKSGEKLEQLMNEEGLSHDFIKIAGNTRHCFAILDKELNTLTEINENGPFISTKELKAFIDKFTELSTRANIVVISGSIPSPMDQTIYSSLITIARQKGAITVLDASGSALKSGIGSSPYIIKPNRQEAEELLGFKLDSSESLLKGINFLCNYCRIACITLEDKGCVIGTKNEIYHIVPPAIKVINSVGSGDTFLAGFIHSFLQNEPLDKSGALATASGSANAMTDRAGFFLTGDVEAILKKIKVKKLL